MPVLIFLEAEDWKKGETPLVRSVAPRMPYRRRVDVVGVTNYAVIPYLVWAKESFNIWNASMPNAQDAFDRDQNAMFAHVEWSVQAWSATQYTFVWLDYNEAGAGSANPNYFPSTDAPVIPWNDNPPSGWQSQSDIIACAIFQPSALVEDVKVQKFSLRPIYWKFRHRDARFKIHVMAGPGGPGIVQNHLSFHIYQHH